MKQKHCTFLFFILLFFTSCLLINAQQVDTISVHSDKMGIDVKNILILPKDYKADSDKKYPVIYLLHGYGGNHTTWLKGVKNNLPDLATLYQFIIVCPDGKNSWYFNSPTNPKSQYDNYVSHDLVNYVDSLYNTISSPKGRAITGLSMGGHGALWLTIQHPDIFGAAGSTSGGVDIRPFPKNWEIPNSLGSYIGNEDMWNSHTVIENIQILKDKNTPLIIDCGQSDFFLEVNENLHKKLLGLKMLHTYITSPGEHNSKYWNKSIDRQLKFFSDFFESNKSVN